METFQLCKLISIEDTFAETKALGDNDSRERNPEMMGRRDTLSVYNSFFYLMKGNLFWENVKQCACKGMYIKIRF